MPGMESGVPGYPRCEDRGDDDRRHRHQPQAGERAWRHAHRPGQAAPGRAVLAASIRAAPLVGDAEAHRPRVPGRQPHRLGGGAHLLRGARDLPGADRARLDPRPGRRLGDRRRCSTTSTSSPPARRTRSSSTRSTRSPPAGAPPGSAFVLGLARRAVVGLGLRRRASRAPRTRSTRSRRGARSGSCGRCRSGSRCVMILLLAICALAVVVTGPAGRGGRRRGRRRRHRGDRLGHRQVAGDRARRRDPDLLVLYYAAPNVRQPGFRWITPGGVLAVVALDRWPRPASPSTSPTSAPTTPPTAASPA